MTPQRSRLTIGICGPPASGKTVFLSVLYGRIETDPRMRAREWRVKGKDETHRLFMQNYNRLVGRRLGMPVQTDETVPYEFRIGGYGRFALGRLSADLTCEDHPGQFLLLGDDASKKQDFYQRLACSHGILYFIDPLLRPEELQQQAQARGGARLAVGHQDRRTFYQAHLRDLFHYLREWLGTDGPLPQVFAFIITKADARKELWDRRGQPEAVLEFAVGPEGLTLIRNVCQRWRAYVSSSTGAYLDGSGAYMGANVEDFTLPDGNIGRRLRSYDHFRPVNVLEPVQWMLEELKQFCPVVSSKEALWPDTKSE